MLVLVGLIQLTFVAAPPAKANMPAWSVVALGKCADVGAGEPARALRDAIGKQLPGQVATEEQTAQALGGSASASLDQANRLFGVARTDFTAGDLTRADHDLAEARDIFMSLAPSQRRWDGVRDAETMSSWMEIKQGRRKEAEASLRQILAVDPDYTPSEYLYPPMVRNLNQVVWRTMKKEARSTITVRTDPPGLPVYVGARPIGPSPAKLAVPPGHYRVEAGFSGARGMPQEIEVDGPTQVSLSAKIEGAVWQDRGPCLTAPAGRSERLALLDHIAAVLHAQKLVGIEFEEPSPGERYLGATVLDATSGQELRAARVKLDPDTSQAHAVEQLAAFVVTGRAPESVQVMESPSAEPAAAIAAPKPTPAAAAPVVPTATTQAQASGASGMRIASYITAGVGVAALGFGVAELVRKGSATSDFNAVYPQAHAGDPTAIQQAQDAESRANSASTLATVGLVVGGAAVATGVVLFIVSGHSSTVQPTVAFDGRQTTVALAGRF